MGSDSKKDYLRSPVLLRRCLGYFTPYKTSIALAVVSMGIVAVSSSASAYLFQPAWDSIFAEHDRSKLVVYPLLMILVFALKGVFRYAQNYLMRMCGLKVLERLRNELHEKILRLPMNFFDDTQVGMLQSRIIMDVNMIRNSLPAIVMLVRSVLEVIGLLGVAFYMNPGLASLAVFVLPLAVYPIIYFGKKLRKIGRKNQVKLSDISVILNEAFSGIRVVKAFATERHENARFAVENRRLVDIARKEVVFSEMSSPIMDMVGALGIAVVMWYCGQQVMDGEITQGMFISFVAAAGLIYEPIKKFNSYNMDVQRALAGAERVFEILDAPEIVQEEGGQTEFAGPFEELRLEGVTFAYPGCARPALHNVSLTVRAGQRVALVGPSGSGKTTLVNLLPRFYLPQAGAVVLNGRPVEDYTLASLRRNIGIVSQDAFLFDTTVRDNIAYGHGEVDPERIESCARAAYAHEFVQQMPAGYDTVLGERGVKLSGGQKQRLTIARALFKNPPLLILDEATSALDTESERKVQAALENLMQNRTSIVIAHRLSTVVGADVIVVMEQGRVVSTGTHAELLAGCPLYARLHSMQFRDEPQDGLPGCDMEPA
ncbi:lipid A export permease/ATP-binding protein MsbA [Desulfocurvus vexinensis]|uniref:lipid A export permease/ATP-binding protein MsbA n=1 Tax=Desulfocurvus vexinensis TaxID=399548 RepID=UPI0004B96064|nr:lipid A export permease/ATP-binding protein MsbA [Desulfocurvus vexinensis]